MWNKALLCNVTAGNSIHEMHIQTKRTKKKHPRWRKRDGKEKRNWIQPINSRALSPQLTHFQLNYDFWEIHWFALLLKMERIFLLNIRIMAIVAWCGIFPVRKKATEKNFISFEATFVIIAHHPQSSVNDKRQKRACIWSAAEDKKKSSRIAFANIWPTNHIQFRKQTNPSIFSFLQVLLLMIQYNDIKGLFIGSYV